MTGHESSRQALEHSNTGYLHSQEEHEQTRKEHAANVVAHAAQEREIAALAYKLWQGRSSPEGSPEEDWFRAAEQVRSQE